MLYYINYFFVSVVGIYKRKISAFAAQPFEIIIPGN